jgi:hypothetical protein
MNPKSDIVAKYENHYKRLSKEFGREMKPEDYWFSSARNYASLDNDLDVEVFLMG